MTEVHSDMTIIFLPLTIFVHLKEKRVNLLLQYFCVPLSRAFRTSATEKNVCTKATQTRKLKFVSYMLS